MASNPEVVELATDVPVRKEDGYPQLDQILMRAALSCAGLDASVQHHECMDWIACGLILLLGVATLGLVRACDRLGRSEQ